MKIKGTILIVAATLFAVAGIAQTAPDANVDKAVEKKIRKQVLVVELENRVRELNLAAPRVMARYRVAKWLWSEGKDEIGRAEELAVAAIEDLYKNRVEVPPVYFSNLSADLFALLDRNSPAVSKTLKEKYKIKGADAAAVEEALFSQPGGEKAAVDAAIRSLYSSGSSDDHLSLLLYRLQQRKSPELYRLLNNVVAAEERAPGRLSATTLAFISPYFGGTDVQPGISQRFAKIILDRSRAASQLPVADFNQWLTIVNSNLPMITERSPDLVPDAEIVRAVLTSRISRDARGERERNERINNSIDKLGTMIEEAEKAEDPILKYDLYRRAAKLALEKALYKRSVDLALLSADVDVSSMSILVQTQKNEAGQMLEAVMKASLTADDPASALYAVDNHINIDRKAHGYADVATFYIEKGDLDAARSVMRSAVRSTANVEHLPTRASIYLKLIPISHRIDPTSVLEMNALAAKSVNSIPSLNVEDKPETENFQNHVSGLMMINWNLFPMLTEFAKDDRNGAADLFGRIEKKEVKVFAEMVLGINSVSDLSSGEEVKKPDENPKL